jgi:SAM-dependent methyltransferase
MPERSSMEDFLTLYSTRRLIKELFKRLKKNYRKNRTKQHIGITNIEAAYKERMWEWLAKEADGSPEDWVRKWIESHPASSVGKSNISNRERWLKKTLRKIPKGKKILDAGAGELQYKKYCEHLKYTSQDFAEYNGEGNTSGLQMGSWDNTKLDIVSDITSIPVANASFDAIMCVEVFEHIPKPIDAIKEFSRILKKTAS